MNEVYYAVLLQLAGKTDYNGSKEKFTLLSEEVNDLTDGLSVYSWEFFNAKNERIPLKK